MKFKSITAGLCAGALCVGLVLPVQAQATVPVFVRPGQQQPVKDAETGQEPVVPADSGEEAAPLRPGIDTPVETPVVDGEIAPTPPITTPAPTPQPVPNPLQDPQVAKKYAVKNIVLQNGNLTYNFPSSMIYAFIWNPNTAKMDLKVDQIKLAQAIDHLAKSWNIAGRDAIFSINKNGIVTSGQAAVDGKTLNREKTIQDLTNKIKNLDYTPYTPSFTITKSTGIQVNDMKSINSELSHFSTNFQASIKGRTFNIRKAADAINGKILMPGQVFSFNQAVGKISLQNGYQNAPVIVSGELVEGVGGGVCQVSTTLFNTVLRAGLDIVSRRNHSLPIPYVKRGMDAVITDSIDFRFRNSNPNPVYLQAYVSGATLHIKLYGNDKDKKSVTLDVKNTAPNTYKLTRTVNGKVSSFNSVYRNPKKK